MGLKMCFCTVFGVHCRLNFRFIDAHDTSFRSLRILRTAFWTRAAYAGDTSSSSTHNGDTIWTKGGATISIRRRQTITPP